ncbi:tail fiber domain-containing protein [Flavobacterium sp.]|uniref:tail fiber domain-containing protein n=1 Tax=Flavobacterium sp. TaxID=239 RepID=UPI002B4ACD72|nr:tail fiber domain-containing protein [Flavobacterium sp.]HLP65465.1 tail fiber domain-containing protein [Flavobacterium sp.]
MKKITTVLALLVASFGFAQNQSFSAVQSSITTPIGQQFSGGEIFRFNPGLVTQLDNGTAFDFTSSRWFSFGRLNTGTQTVYGMRFQLPNKALTLGYQDLADLNPRLQWIGSGTGLGNFEFRAANSFTSTLSTLVATMTNDGNTYFGDALFTGTKVGIDYKTNTGLFLRTTYSSSNTITGIKMQFNTNTYIKEAINIDYTGSSYANFGINMNLSGAVNSQGISTTVSGSSSSTGINSTAKDASNNVAVRGTISNAGSFGAAIYGISPTTNTNWHAGLFDGKVVVNGSFSNPSDEKLKKDIKKEEQILEKLMQLDPVNYNFAPNDKINLPEGLQHGFLAQNIEKVFPQLIIPVKSPTFNKEGEVIDYYDYKTVNYLGIISLLTTGIKELNQKVASLEQTVEELRNNKSSDKGTNSADDETKFSLEQNVPNPFENQTAINYTLPRNTQASLAIFDMTGKLIKEINLVNQKGQIIVQASEIGQGMFLFSLVSGNQEIITKKMIVK